MRSVVIFCTILPLSRVCSVSFDGSGISSVHQPRAKTAALGKGLAGEKLAGVALPVAHAALVVAGISCDILERAACRNVTAGLADDQGEFAIIVKIVAHLGL